MMEENQLTFAPLTKPKNWPPVARLPATLIEWYLWWIPIVGWLTALLIAAIREELYYRNILTPMAKEIIHQLVARQDIQLWPETKQQQTIVEFVSQTLGFEKGIAPPLLHPKDSCTLLFWGLFDDLSPSTFRTRIQQRFGLRLNDKELIRFSQDNWTLKSLVEYCDRNILAGN